jgi:hypothetical protein
MGDAGHLQEDFVFLHRKPIWVEEGLELAQGAFYDYYHRLGTQLLKTVEKKTWKIGARLPPDTRPKQDHPALCLGGYFEHPSDRAVCEAARKPEFTNLFQRGRWVDESTHCTEFSDGYVYKFELNGTAFSDGQSVSTPAEGHEIHTLTGMRYELSHILGTQLVAIADKEKGRLGVRPVSSSLEGYSKQPSFAKPCKQAPAGKSCLEFTDHYRWIVRTDTIFGEETLKLNPQVTLVVKRGCLSDYYHVLWTDLVRVEKIQLPEPPKTELKPPRAQ